MTEDLRAPASRAPRPVDLALVVPVLAIVIRRDDPHPGRGRRSSDGCACVRLRDHRSAVARVLAALGACSRRHRGGHDGRVLAPATTPVARRCCPVRWPCSPLVTRPPVGSVGSARPATWRSRSLSASLSVTPPSAELLILVGWAFGGRARGSVACRPRGTGRQPNGSASCTPRNRPSPTNACASPATCTTPWLTRCRPSTSSPASPPTSSTVTPTRRSGAGGDPRREQRRPRRVDGDPVGDAGAGWRQSVDVARGRRSASSTRSATWSLGPRADGLPVDAAVHGDVGAVGSVRECGGVPGRARGAHERPAARRGAARAEVAIDVRGPARPVPPRHATTAMGGSQPVGPWLRRRRAAASDCSACASASSRRAEHSTAQRPWRRLRGRRCRPLAWGRARP